MPARQGSIGETGAEVELAQYGKPSLLAENSQVVAPRL
jgi:hypothetical protein